MHRFALNLALALAVPASAQQRTFADWRQYLGGSDSSQYSSLKQISKGNVGRLEIAWTYSTGDANQYLFNPIVIDGVMYVQAKNNSLVALDATTGKEIWVHSFTGAVTTRGINYWESKDRSDRRLFTTNAGFLTAIDARNGKTIESFGDNGRVDARSGLNDRDWSDSPPIQTNNPGRIFEDVIILPLMRSGGDYAYLPGDVHAYDVRTGKLVWQFHTVPRPGEFGYETWPKDFWQRSGGGINWNELTIDEKHGIAFIPTGTGKWDHYGADRKGQNLSAGPKLLTVKHDGKNVDIAVQPSKQGFLYVLERLTGQPLWPIEERPVPKSDVPGEEAWPTQPFPTKPPPFARQALTERDVNPYLPEAEQEAWREKIHSARNEGIFTPPSLKGTLSIPGVGGGASWATTAADPTKGTLYVVSKDAPTIITLVPPGSPNSDKRGAVPSRPAPIPVDGPFVHYTAPYTQLISQGTRLPAISPPWFQMTAYDLNS